MLFLASDESSFVTGATLTTDELCAASPTSRPAVTVDPFAPAAIAYTSGTTGWPKGAVHSQHNLVTVGAVTRYTNGWRALPRHAAVLPLATLVQCPPVFPVIVVSAMVSVPP